MSGHGHAQEGHGHAHGHSHGGVECNGHGSQDAEQPLLKKEVELDQEQRKLRWAVYFALFMMSVEIIGGILANSLAIITDAAHMLSDVGGFIVSLVCLQLATQGVTTEYTFGFKQAEVLGALLSIMIVWGLTAILLWEAFARFHELQEVDAPVMFGISVLGFLVNLVLMKVLGHGHSHGDHGGHGHSHEGHGSACAGEESASLAMKAAIAHVIGDIVQSLGVCLAALCIWLKPFGVGVTAKGISKWNYADPCCTVLFGILVLFTTKSTLVQALDSLMVKAPVHINQAALTAKLNSCPHVKSTHDLHVWALGSKNVLCTAHLMVDAGQHCTAALLGAIQVAKEMGIGHSTFQIEIEGEFDPALESYGLHDNPMASPLSASPAHDSGRRHGHIDQGHGQDSGGHGHSHGGALCNGH